MFKNDFPILKRNINNFPLIYLDNASTTQKPKVVMDRMVEFLENSNANIHRGIYTLTEESTTLFENCRIKLATFLSQFFIDEITENQIVFTKNTTESINIVANSFMSDIKGGETILISILEHHSNMLPWRKLAVEKGINIEWMEAEDYNLTPEILENHLKNNSSIKFVALTGCSNVTGGLIEIDKTVELCRKFRVKLLIDGAQWLPHVIWEDNKYLTPDFLVFSAHKILGPTGVGVLYIKDPTSLTTPYMVGGNTVTKVSKNEIIYKTGYELYEAGTQDICSVISFAESIQYIQEKKSYKVNEHLQNLNILLHEKLSEISEIQLYSPKESSNRIPLFSFSINNIHPHDISDFLDKSGIAVRSGQHCTGVLHDELGIKASTRVSAYIYNEISDILSLIENLKKCIQYYK